MLWRDESVKLKALVNDDAEYYEAITPWKRCRVLYIDDLFKGGASGPDTKLAFEIINFRYNDPKLRTIISSELTVHQLMQLDEAIGSRIYQKTKGFYLEFGKGKNWRLR